MKKKNYIPTLVAGLSIAAAVTVALSVVTYMQNEKKQELSGAPVYTTAASTATVPVVTTTPEPLTVPSVSTSAIPAETTVPAPKWPETPGYKQTEYNGTTVWYKIAKEPPVHYKTNAVISVPMKNEYTGEIYYEDVKKQYPTVMITEPGAISAGASEGYVINAVTTPHFPVYADGRWFKINYTPEKPWYDTLLMNEENELVYYPHGTSIETLKDEHPVWCIGGFDGLIIDGVTQTDIISGENHFDNIYTYENNENIATEKKPRTFIGQLSDKSFFFGVCAGRNFDNNSPGFTYRELYGFVVDKIAYGNADNVRQLFNLDGGGTSTFIYKGEKLNSHYADNDFDQINDERACSSVFIFRDSS